MDTKCGGEFWARGVLMVTELQIAGMPWLIAAGGVCLALCLGAQFVGDRLGVMDHPDGDRKRHSGPTPQVGGIAIILSLTVWICALLAGSQLADGLAPLVTVLLSATGAGLIGFIDDQSPTTPLARLLSLAVLLGLVFMLLPELIAPAINWGSFSPTHIPAWAFGLLASFAVIGLVNAVNMADGQNGIASGMFVVWSVCLMLVGDPLIATVAYGLLIASLIVLVFNLAGKLFLGDCGTYGVTVVFALLAIMAHARNEASAETVALWFLVPVTDCVRLIIARMLRGRSPADGDRNHLHHHLQNEVGMTFSLISYTGAVAVTSIAGSIAPHYDLFYLASLASLYFGFIYFTSGGTAPRGEAATVHTLETGLLLLQRASDFGTTETGAAVRTPALAPADCANGLPETAHLAFEPIQEVVASYPSQESWLQLSEQLRAGDK